MLEAHSLGCVRSGRRLFSGLTLRLAAGGLLLVRGPNGSGKTTLLRMLAGLAPASEGDLRREGAGGVLWIGHRPGVTADLTARENLAFTCALEGGDPVGIPEALAAVGLDDFAEVPAGRLSEGQRRRVALARLQASRRLLWFLDEPLTALDEKSVAWVEGRIQAHRARGGAVAMATHRALATAQDAQFVDLPG